jgi:hypothetical protein
MGSSEGCGIYGAVWLPVLFFDANPYYSTVWQVVGCCLRNRVLVELLLLTGM